jgi:predicted ArsR family transcriptional regulator
MPARRESAAQALSSLGGLAEVQTLPDGRLALNGFSCPLTETVAEHPEVCQVAEALVRELTGLEVQEQCDRSPGELPRCRLVVRARAVGRT